MLVEKKTKNSTSEGFFFYKILENLKFIPLKKKAYY